MIGAKVIHCSMLAFMMIGYLLQNTANVALSSRYASSECQGRAIGLVDSLKYTAQIISPIIAGYLYIWSKEPGGYFGDGSLAMSAAGFMSIFGAICPTILYLFWSNRARGT